MLLPGKENRLIVAVSSLETKSNAHGLRHAFMFITFSRMDLSPHAGPSRKARRLAWQYSRGVPGLNHGANPVVGSSAYPETSSLIVIFWVASSLTRTLVYVLHSWHSFNLYMLACLFHPLKLFIQQLSALIPGALHRNRAHSYS